MNIDRIILAPMEGVLDYHVRQILTEINALDYCVTEFVRITHHKLSNRTFYRLCPELHHGGNTASGTPVRVQILGQSPEWMAENAVKAIELGSHGVDINFGCPAKTVVGSHGGAYLLQYPDQIFNIVKQVRQAMGTSEILSVKIRLGWADKSYCYEIADAIALAGANELVIHGRTKADGYQADKIDWQTIGNIKQRVDIPIIANGEIFSTQNAQDCVRQSQTSDIMLGRGILTVPNLANIIRFNEAPLSWQNVLNILMRYATTTIEDVKPLYHSARIKQWLAYFRQYYAPASDLLSQIRTLKTQKEISEHLKRITDQSQHF
ncbi:tRNA dihydrouridine(16) synthase DusC [Gilliamella sp. B2717]|uniref:tRNA dihydrouridine(16) synthase DusC n=1 Tax=unclassified Gilliamella TaxID=2685620 RepID=UPI00226A3147|nr:tRNA dihydrouridine(16) synthase DusC [Gilliamella sp. B2717]MCX8579935.1 tRNA dihydrouridine(16) synthase DusC [Gilliamella sp. B2717]